MTDAPAHILVIDDDKALRDACYQILSRQGYQVEQAAGARQGLALLERWPGAGGLLVAERAGRLEARVTPGFPLKPEELNLN